MFIDFYLWSKTVIWYFHWLLIASLILFLILIYFKFENRRAVLLFSLALPGALAWCVTIAAGISVAAFPRIANSLFGLFMAFPSAWLLVVVATVQLFKLRAPRRNIGLLGILLAALIAALYPWTSLIDRML
jgi:hypothetical protein